MNNGTKDFNLKYGVLALPIAMVALPIYIYVPKFYGHELGMPIEVVGLILLCMRIFDAVQDPFIGFFSDKHSNKVTRKRMILIGSPFLVIGFLAIFNPLTASSSGHAVWLAISLIIVYFGLSIVYINTLLLALIWVGVPMNISKLLAIEHFRCNWNYSSSNNSRGSFQSI